jgi:hypothetical protein
MEPEDVAPRPLLQRFLQAKLHYQRYRQLLAAYSCCPTGHHQQKTASSPEPRHMCHLLHRRQQVGTACTTSSIHVKATNNDILGAFQGLRVSKSIPILISAGAGCAQRLQGIDTFDQRQ